ncbi:unnamed protein product [Adineta ricciae]|uniref:Protein kinase domain-containing protein n=1 Tax=Adineta ricciae TaxID=249248 RepID=A0A815LL45_ADIRI|nr:unnamed protein product [Adineta ricciae]
MALHYRKDGGLDMRYSSSRAAMSSGFSMGASGFSGGGHFSPMNYGSNASSGLHYKKDGGLDMRYSSSRIASAFATPLSSRPPTSSELHYKKDGTMDMRYSSSRVASTSTAASPISRQPVSSGLHYKKDGGLDMRYSSSRVASASLAPSSSRPPTSSELHYKKDGTMDMRYNSSKAATSSIQSNNSSKHHYKKDGSLDMRYSSSRNTITNNNHEIPKYIPVTKTGIPDMRTTAAKDWVKQQAQNDTGEIPSWIPKTKDGSFDISKAITQEYLKWKDTTSKDYSPDQRLDYYSKKLADMLFQNLVENAREDQVDMPQYEMLPNTDDIQHQLCSRPNNSCPLRQNYRDDESDDDDDDNNNYSFRSARSHRNINCDIRSEVSELIPVINYEDLNIDFENPLGRGSFGTVYKGRWKYQIVAIKQLHLNRLSRQEKKSFVKEIKIMSSLGKHRNLVDLHGYTLEPLCLIMEYVQLGSLSYLLHYCEDPQIEAKITDGRIKKKIILGIVLGMIQLHKVEIVHGDLKPQNILITEDYTAKITDFGFATLRGKTSSSIASSKIADEQSQICGTAGYMAPELLSTSSPPEYSSDVYSFGIMFNEILQEEEPYADQFQNFAGRGPFGAVNHAKLGNRPRISGKTPIFLKHFIQKCWHQNPRNRPDFEQIFHDLKPSAVEIPHSF